MPSTDALNTGCAELALVRMGSGPAGRVTRVQTNVSSNLVASRGELNRASGNETVRGPDSPRACRVEARPCSHRARRIAGRQKSASRSGPPETPEVVEDELGEGHVASIDDVRLDSIVESWVFSVGAVIAGKNRIRLETVERREVDLRVSGGAAQYVAGATGWGDDLVVKRLIVALPAPPERRCP